MIYFFQTIFYSATFWLVFKMFLADKPMHEFNRFYLLGSSVLPFILPFIQFSSAVSKNIKSTVFNFALPEFIVPLTGYIQPATGIHWFQIIYVSISVFMFLVLLCKLRRLRNIANSSERIEKAGYEILLNTGCGPGSWGRYIFLPAGLPNERIIQHESTHIRLRHSLDTLVLSVLQCAFWYNPFIYLFSMELKMVHEYQADTAVGGNDPQYKELLLSNIFSTQNLYLINTFFHHPIKKRIMMFNQKISTSSKLLRSIVSLIVLTTFAILFVGFQSSMTSANESTVSITDNNSAEFIAGDSVLAYVEKMPVFDGNLSKFLADNLVYPIYAKDNKIEGRVTLKFVIDKEGNVTNKQVVRSPHDTLSQAALDVLDKMPKWIPGEQKGKKVAVSFTLPVSFKLK